MCDSQPQEKRRSVLDISLVVYDLFSFFFDYLKLIDTLQAQVRAMVLAMGGRFSQDLLPENTHLIANGIGSLKYKVSGFLRQADWRDLRASVHSYDLHLCASSQSIFQTDAGRSS
jgi:hypothetical protein